MPEDKAEYQVEDKGLLDRLLSVLEDWQLARLLFHIAGIINGTGYGEINIVIKDRHIDEVNSTMREKIRKKANIIL